ncbi:MAG: PEP-CTERM sorting domain-containing protein, partial [Armatimonadota bacterium]|nr:PEP-CTERM sorting domain-containing protein [Armatimonadota bacterium]
GQIIGRTVDSLGFLHYVLWNADLSIVDFGIEGFIPYAINNAGQIVGQTADKKAALRDTDGSLTVLPGLDALAQSQALGINDAGWIVGYSFDASYNSHAVLWQPVPEPSSLLTLAGGLAGLGGFALRRKRSK